MTLFKAWNKLQMLHKENTRDADTLHKQNPRDADGAQDADGCPWSQTPGARPWTLCRAAAVWTAVVRWLCADLCRRARLRSAAQVLSRERPWRRAASRPGRRASICTATPVPRLKSRPRMQLSFEAGFHTSPHPTTMWQGPAKAVCARFCRTMCSARHSESRHPSLNVSSFHSPLLVHFSGFSSITES